VFLFARRDAGIRSANAMFESEKSSAGTESESKTDAEQKSETQEETKDDLDKIEGLGDKGKEAIRKEREAAKAAADRAKDAETKLAALEKEKSEREVAEQTRKDKEAAEAGKWEELATKREAELKSAKDEAAALKSQNDQYKAAVEKVLTDEWKALPAEAIEAYEAAGGKDDDPLGKLSFLPAGKKIAAKLAEKGDTARGNGRDPRPRGDGKGNDEAARKAQAPMYRNF
jgi:DNA repair exonuclease SbcCD ATPase subunit